MVSKRASNDTIFIAGHAKDNAVKNTRAEVMHFRNYLTAVLDHVRAGIKAGQSNKENPEAACAEGLRRQRVAERPLDDGDLYSESGMTK